MTSGIGIVGLTAGVATPPVVSAPASSGTGAAFTVPQPTETPAVAAQGSRTLIDPSAGFITQYLSANGSQVVTQTPTAITVAYLRLGLTPDGLSKPATTGPVGTTA